MNKNKYIYWAVTGLFSLMILGGASMYLFNTEMVATNFTKLGYPTHLIYPLAILKILGITAILTKKSQTLKEWAYAGFFFNLSLAVMAHINAGDGEAPAAGVALTLLLTSYGFDRLVFGQKAQKEENVSGQKVALPQ